MTCPGKWSICPLSLDFLNIAVYLWAPCFSPPFFLYSWLFTWEDTCLLSPVRRLLLLSLLGLSCPGARRALHLFASAAVTTTDWAAWNNRNVLACRLDTRRLTWVSLSYITNWQDEFLSGSSFSNVQRPPVFLGSRLSLSTFKASIGGSAPSHIASFHLFVQSHRSLPLSLTLLLPPPSF